MQTLAQTLAQELGQNPTYVENVIALIDEGNTIPFIARYRKEQHGAMDDAVLRTLADRLTYLRSLDSRREEVKRSIAAQGKLTDELAKSIEQAGTLTEVEDLYRPYKQKRHTRASMARDKGLEPLAARLFLQLKNSEKPEEMALNYLNKEKDVPTVEEALRGASDILAEMISDDAVIRKRLRELSSKKAFLVAKAAKEEDSVYRLYYDFRRPLSRVQDHQVLAINRGEKEGFLKVGVELDRELALRVIAERTLRGDSPAGALVRRAGEDSYDRLIFPSVERELRAALTETANEGAIRNFALNLRPLLMQPPVRGKVTMGLDPGYRNGCKVAVVDGTGKVMATAVVYPTFNAKKRQEAINTLKQMVRACGVEHIAIGNGTASRETEEMTAELIREVGGGLRYMIVNEAGASVYSASALAAEELPELDVNLRSAVSIARRLQDPLAELVKIEPRAIGVGQYQHDMPQARLDAALNGVVEDCVNAVGVDVNTASPALLNRVSGLTAATAKNIVAYREAHGPFNARKQLLQVPKLGPRAYQQCAGFLRVPESGQVLDHTAVHPESYGAAEKLLTLCGYTLADVSGGDLRQLPARLEQIGASRAEAFCGAGMLTLRDVAEELRKPGRDPRDELPPPILRTDVLSINDLQPGMVLTGTVRNVIDFGVFVDVGVHQDGLVHISEICDRYLKHPSEVLQVGDVVRVVVLSVDAQKKRISLSIKQAGG